MELILAVVWIIVFIICWRIFHKFFIVIHFDGPKGCLEEIITIGFIATVIIGVILIPFLDDDITAGSEEAGNTEIRSEIDMSDYNNNKIVDYDNGKSDYSTENYSEYILPESNVRYINEEDICNLSPEELRLARNEIYARYGRIFKSEELRNYFNSKSWYTPLVTAENFNESSFNEYEKANINFIVAYEQEQR